MQVDNSLHHQPEADMAAPNDFLKSIFALAPQSLEAHIEEWYARHEEFLAVGEEREDGNPLAPKMENGRLVLSLYHPIASHQSSFFGTNVTPGNYRDATADLKEGTPIEIRIDSPGGDVFAARNILQHMDRQIQSGRKVETVAEGLAASAASHVFANGTKRTMLAGTRLMIHDSSGLVVGNASDMKKMADKLDGVDEDQSETLRILSKPGKDEEGQVPRNDGGRDFPQWKASKGTWACGCDRIQAQSTSGRQGTRKGNRTFHKQFSLEGASCRCALSTTPLNKEV